MLRGCLTAIAVAETRATRAIVLLTAVRVAILGEATLLIAAPVVGAATEIFTSAIACCKAAPAGMNSAYSRVALGVAEVEAPTVVLAVIKEAPTIPVASVKSCPKVAKPIINAAIEANRRAPVTDVP